MKEIDGDLVFGEVDHNNFTHATASLAGKLAVDGLRSSGDAWIGSMAITPTPVALAEGGFGVSLHTTTAYDAEMLTEMAGTECRLLTVDQTTAAVHHPSVEGVVTALRSGKMARSAQ